MARGWESKDVESQMDDAREQGRSSSTQLTTDEIRIQRERESLLLHRSRVLADLEKAGNPRYRELLHRSLAFLDEKLAALN